jgi:hypothetical protein
MFNFIKYSKQAYVGWFFKVTNATIVQKCFTEMLYHTSPNKTDLYYKQMRGDS